MDESIKFTEAELNQAITELLSEQGYTACFGESISRSDGKQVLIEQDLRKYLRYRYPSEELTTEEVDYILRALHSLMLGDLYESNRAFCSWLANGIWVPRTDRSQKDLHIELIDTRHLPQALAELFAPQPREPENTTGQNLFKIVSQLKVRGESNQQHILDQVLYINGLPLIVFEFKSAMQEQADLRNAWQQICVCYKQNIPQMFVYNALCILSDGESNRVGSLFMPYESFYAWRKVSGNENIDKNYFSAIHRLIHGLLHPVRLLDVIENYIIFPEDRHHKLKICGRDFQYYSVRRLYFNIKADKYQQGNAKGGTYLWSKGCGKNISIAFLRKLLLKSSELSYPSIILITDRIYSKYKFKHFLLEDFILIESKSELQKRLEDINGGAAIIATIQKLSKDTEQVSGCNNIVCIFDEAHRTQAYIRNNLYKYFPNATYIGITECPTQHTLDTFGQLVAGYTMLDSIQDGFSVPICYEDRSNKIQSETYKEASPLTSLKRFLENPARIKAIAEDFIEHYEAQVANGNMVKGKVIFSCASRKNAYALYQQIEALRPNWFLKTSEDNPSKPNNKTPIVKILMSRIKSDKPDIYQLVGTKEDQFLFMRGFESPDSHFCIAIVVNMLLQDFDTPELDAIYFDKPLEKHYIIQVISRLNRRKKFKSKGTIIDYFGFKDQLDSALYMYLKDGLISDFNYEKIIHTPTGIIK